MAAKSDHALVSVPTDGLKLLLRQVHRGELPCPLDVPGIACQGLQSHSEALMSVLRGLGRDGVWAVLVAVLAERKAAADAQDLGS